MPQIQFMNPSTGLIEMRDVPDGTTDAQFKAQITPPDAAEDEFLLTVNRNETDGTHVLQEGEMVRLIAQKIDGN